MEVAESYPSSMGEISRGGHLDPDRKSGSGLRDHLEASGLSGSGLEDGLDASGLSGSGWYFDPDSRDLKVVISRDFIPTFSPTFRENWPKKSGLVEDCPSTQPDF